MEPFLDRVSFGGSPDATRPAARSFVGQARFDGCIAFTNWTRKDVAALLPPDVRLAANTTSTPHLHPVVFVFGEHSRGTLLFGGLAVPTGIAYFEFGMAIPFVEDRGGLGVYVPRMYASWFPPVWSGNVHYGFAKRLARMGWHGSVFVVGSDAEGLLLHAAAEPAGGWSPGSGCGLPHFAALRETFSLPIVGRRDDGSLVRSFFDWGFDTAMVRPADSCISIDGPVLDGLAPRRCHDAPAGTFEVRGMVWRLSWPA